MQQIKARLWVIYGNYSLVLDDCDIDVLSLRVRPQCMSAICSKSTTLYIAILCTHYTLYLY